jgi:hypothetical protein
MAGKPCEVGTAAELMAAALISAQGITVSLPWGHAQGYDLVTDVDDTLQRVQVRHAAYRIGRDRYEADLRKPRPWAKERMTCQGDFDTLAVMAGLNLYLMPARLVLGRTMVVMRPPGCRERLGGPAPVFDIELYREAWAVLKECG